jgi:hypothetical protein
MPVMVQVYFHFSPQIRLAYTGLPFGIEIQFALMIMVMLKKKGIRFIGVPDNYIITMNGSGVGDGAFDYNTITAVEESANGGTFKLYIGRGRIILHVVMVFGTGRKNKKGECRYHKYLFHN